MTRLRSVFWLLLAGVAGLAVLFQVKYEVQTLEKRMESLNRQIARDEKAVHVLQAEWSYLNEPGRLTELAQRHLDLTPLTAQQLVSFDDVPMPVYPLNPGIAMPPQPEDVQPAGGPSIVKPKPTVPAEPKGEVQQADATGDLIAVAARSAPEQPEDAE